MAPGHTVLALLAASAILACATAFLGDVKPIPVPVHALSPPGTTHKDTPLPYVGTTATAVLITMEPSPRTRYSDVEADNIKVDIAGQGPVPWSISRWNQGDLSPRIDPRHPYAQTNLGDFPGERGFFSYDPQDFSTQAWRPDPEKGVLLATVAHNGQNWHDGTPIFYGTVACVTNSQGFGYSMKTGQYGNSNPNMDVALGKAGKQGEANIDVAVAWFPYEQGWTGGYVSAPDTYSKQAAASWLSPNSHSPDLPRNLSDALRWGKRGARLRLPGVHPYSDGLLFLISTDPGKANNDINVVSAYTKPWGKGWRVQAREDSSSDPTQLVDSTEHMFAFLYVPFSSTGMIGASVSANGEVVKGEGDFHVNRVREGMYEITIGRGPKTPSDGVLLLQVTGRDDKERKYAKHAYMSYNYTDKGVLLVEAHRLVLVREPGGYVEEVFPFVDTDFSFLWVDFKHPLTPERDMFTGRLLPGYSSYKYWMGFMFGLGIGACTLALSLIFMPHALRGLSSINLGTFRLPSRSLFSEPVALVPLEEDQGYEPLQSTGDGPGARATTGT